ncbi:MAG TPA: hypothetical protein VFD84_11135 [Candidatus Binatia bacterium]|nr:hypothetical protein [Candidatus Binatia bacterium]
MKPIARIAIPIALALTFALVARPATADVGPFADLDGDGQLGPGDVPIADLLKDGRFSTAEAEGAYQPATGPVGVVVPASAKKLSLKSGNLVLIASGDLTIDADVNASSPDSVVLLVSTGGSITVAPGVRIAGGMFVKLSAAGNVTVGDGAAFQTRGHDFGDVLAIVSTGGSIDIGERVSLNGGGLCQIATADEGGGAILIGPKSKLAATAGNVQVTAGMDLVMNGVTITAPDLLLGSHAGERGPAEAYVRKSTLKAGGRDGRIRIYADGAGGMVDLSGTRMKIADTANLLITADQIVHTTP